MLPLQHGFTPFRRNRRRNRIWYFTSQIERANRARKVLRETKYTICTLFLIRVSGYSPSLTIAGRAPVHPGLLTPIENRDDSSNFFNAVTLFPGAAPVEAGQHPGRVPVNPGLATFYRGEAPAELWLSPVMPRWSPGESRKRPERAPVYRNSTCTHRGCTGIRTRQSYGNAPV
ncbi:hypothetical protein DPMN_084785 [Dreissena polymorpha]|uniref:Uncharacterized protein n=1 Tax=Dreissena polymorpha TaxID=45954 RepID=A0A9D3YEX3_DREPO|nr:hypothetical protein DPMN_084785 [Dreissena polymorpha]